MDHHYSLKWNNHPHNISSVFARLREEELFTDVTLATGDRQTIMAHRVVLSAGSLYLERILSINPSDHPTLVLSNIRYRELKLLVDFMYSGEISVDQPVLPGLLEAASWLQVKGLYESRTEQQDGTVPDISSPEPQLSVSPSQPDQQQQQRPAEDLQLLQPPPPQPQQLLAKQNQIPKKRKRSFVEKVVDDQVDIQVDGNLVVQSPKKCNNSSDQVVTPVVGVSNTGWLLNASNDSEKKDSVTPASENSSATVPSLQEDKDDIPKLLNLSTDRQNLLNQLKSEVGNVQESLLQQAALYSSPQHAQMMQAMQNSYLTQLAVLQQQSSAAAAAQLHGSFTSFATSNASSSQPYAKFTGVMNSAPVRRYKQYTETSLQAALKEIEEGQSINRSSMKHNIPARTLRDWMKRMNIKSVYTHNKDGKEGSVGSTSPEPDLNISIEKLRTVFNSVHDEDSESSQQLKIDDDCSKISSVPMVA